MKKLLISSLALVLLAFTSCSSQRFLKGVTLFFTGDVQLEYLPDPANMNPALMGQDPMRYSSFFKSQFPVAMEKNGFAAQYAPDLGSVEKKTDKFIMVIPMIMMREMPQIPTEIAPPTDPAQVEPDAVVVDPGSPEEMEILNSKIVPFETEINVVLVGFTKKGVEVNYPISAKVTMEVEEQEKMKQESETRLDFKKVAIERVLLQMGELINKKIIEHRKKN